MHPAIKTVSDSKRGCGWRHKHGLYLVADIGMTRGCGKLPISLKSLACCPFCDHELPPDYRIKVSRGVRMLQNPEILFAKASCEGGECNTCPLSNAFESGPALLDWIGETYYPTPGDFVEETRRLGTSRRIAQIPNDFIVGETWVLMAHAKAIVKKTSVKANEADSSGQVDMFGREDVEYEPGIFRMFLPTRIEMPVEGNEPDKFIDDLVKRGITPVLIARQNDDGEAPKEEPHGNTL